MKKHANINANPPSSEAAGSERPKVGWTGQQVLHALLDAWTVGRVLCPVCGRECDITGNLLNTRIWCAKCKTGGRSGVVTT